MVVAAVQLGFHAGPQQLEQGLSLNLLPACGSHSPNWAGCLVWSQLERMYLSPAVTCCAQVCCYMVLGERPLHRGEEEGSC